MFVATEGHAWWKAPLIMKEQAPRRFAIWKPLPAFNQPIETPRYALSIAAAPAQPAISHSSSMVSFRNGGWRMGGVSLALDKTGRTAQVQVNFASESCTQADSHAANPSVPPAAWNSSTWAGSNSSVSPALLATILLPR